MKIVNPSCSHINFNKAFILFDILSYCFRLRKRHRTITTSLFNDIFCTKEKNVDMCLAVCYICMLYVHQNTSESKKQ